MPRKKSKLKKVLGEKTGEDDEKLRRELQNADPKSSSGWSDGISVRRKVTMAERPFLSAAFLCEKVLRETDEVLSVVRIVDTFLIAVPKDIPKNARPNIQAAMLLSFIRASASGAETHRGKIIAYKPSGNAAKADPLEFEIMFKDEDVARCNVIVSLALGVEEFGLHRIDVFVDGDLMTRIPFKLLERSEPAKSVQ